MALGDKRLAASVLLACALTACSAHKSGDVQEVIGGQEVVQTPAAPWTLPAHADELKAASCPPGEVYIEPQALDILATPVALTDPQTGESLYDSLALKGVGVVAAYHLTSQNPRLGGLSGVDVLPTGDLLSVSDTGAFVWFGMDAEGVTPVSSNIALMRGPDGQPLEGKRDGDSEGVAVMDDLAIVSFERRHRVEAFALNACGASARASEVWAADETDARFKDNGGMEAAAISPEGGLILGIETLDADRRAPLSFAPRAGVADFSLRLPSMDGKDLTGMDYVPALEGAGGDLYAVHRSYFPGFGNTISITRTAVTQDAEGAYGLGKTSELLFIRGGPAADNFEGLAALRLEDGSVRLYMISDDNFSPKQRTLLYIFNVL